MDSFWKWLFSGSQNGPRGIYNIFNWWLIFHFLIGILATLFIRSDPFTFAGKALFPASSILIGMSMAWTTRASTILQTKDLRKKIFTESRPAEDYIYSFQLSILVIIGMVIYVAILSGGGLKISVFGNEIDTFISSFFLYFVISLSLRECWGVVNFTNMLSMLEYRRK